jgi:hypothetical protein
MMSWLITFYVFEKKKRGNGYISEITVLQKRSGCGILVYVSTMDPMRVVDHRYFFFEIIDHRYYSLYIGLAGAHAKSLRIRQSLIGGENVCITRLFEFLVLASTGITC